MVSTELDRRGVLHRSGNGSSGLSVPRSSVWRDDEDRIRWQHRETGPRGSGQGWTDMAGGDREKALDVALAQIEKQFGKGSVMRLGDETRAPLEVIPTGSIALDVALGLGGLPPGRGGGGFGPESRGKTTLALHAVANAQKAGGIAAFIDAEHALDPDYAQKLGVDTDALL